MGLRIPGTVFVGLNSLTLLSTAGYVIGLPVHRLALASASVVFAATYADAQQGGETGGGQVMAALNDINVQFCLYALSAYLAPPAVLSLAPLAIFAVFPVANSMGWRSVAAATAPVRARAAPAAARGARGTDAGVDAGLACLARAPRGALRILVFMRSVPRPMLTR